MLAKELKKFFDRPRIWYSDKNPHNPNSSPIEQGFFEMISIHVSIEDDAHNWDWDFELDGSLPSNFSDNSDYSEDEEDFSES